MPTINPPPDMVSRIHSRRFNHCLSKMIFELYELNDPHVNQILANRSATILPGLSFGLEYSAYDRQILEKELKEAKRVEAKLRREDVPGPNIVPPPPVFKPKKRRR